MAKAGLRVLAQSMNKELSKEGVHVAHVVVDGMVDMPVIHQFIPDAPEGRMLDTEAIADSYWHLYQQPKRCFTFELDLRPHEATW